MGPFKESKAALTAVFSDASKELDTSWYIDDSKQSCLCNMTSSVVGHTWSMQWVVALIIMEVKSKGHY